MVQGTSPWHCWSRHAHEEARATLIEDLRYAFRSLRIHPGTTAVAAIALAIGIGATTLDKALLHPLPFPAADRLINVWSNDPRSPARQWVSLPDFSDWCWRSRETVEI